MSAVEHAPRITCELAERMATDLYGLNASAVTLPSERDQNFRLRDASGQQFVLKIANAQESFAFIDLQNQLIDFLGSSNIELRFPRIIRSKTGELISQFPLDGKQHYVRLLTWIDGLCFAEVRQHDRRLLSSLGRALAQIDSALAQFSHPAAQRSFYWDLRNAAAARSLIELLPVSRQSVVNHFFNEWEKIDWKALRFSVIHNDANDYNVLVDESEGRVCAILDYGDVVYTATVCNLAIALAYVMLDKRDPIEAAASVIASYHEIYPLTGAEIDVLYILAVTRLCCSVCFAARQTRDAPENEYLNISNAPAWRLLEKLSTIPADWVSQMFRYSCSRPPVKTKFTSHGRTAAELLAARGRYLGPSLSISYDAPLHIVSGSRQYLHEADGRRYLDCVNNVAHVGHSHPRVGRAAAAQMAQLNTNTRFLLETLVEYIEQLTATLPQSLGVVFLVNSGSEANELALRLARAHTGGKDVIVVDAAYHGNTGRMIDISPHKFDGPGGSGRPSWVHQTPTPDVYRGAHHGPTAGKLYAEGVAEMAEKISREGTLAAFFCESALSCAGQIILPHGYLSDAFAAVRRAGGVCIADEVQTGFGRAGEHFWMFESQDVVPDIVTLGKPIGNGHPLGAVITTREIAASFANGMEYFNTFGGNPVSCAVGLAVLEVIRNEELQQNAREVGDYLKQGLLDLQNKHALIGDVRGLGLFMGIEFVRDQETLEPAGREAIQIVERMKERGVLLSTDGPHHNVIKINPPMVFSKAAAGRLISGLDWTLQNDCPRG